MERSLLGVGIYTIPEAARFTHIPAESIRRWLWGSRRRGQGSPGTELLPLWTPEIPVIDDSRALGFRDLVEIQFVHRFRELGLSMQAIRRVIGRAHELLDRVYPLSSVKFKTKGKKILAEVLDDDEKRVVFELSTGQLILEFMWEDLYDGLEYSKFDELLRWWPLGKERRVVIDPRRSFGGPISPEGVPTYILAAALRAEKTVDSVAHWYEVDPDSVRDADDYERTLRAA